MDQNRIEFIYRKCLTNSATVEEQHEFMRLIRLPEHKETAKTILLASFYENQRDVNFDDISAEFMIEAILLSDKNLATPTADLKPAANNLPDSSYPPVAPVHRTHVFKTAWFRYAAILLLIAGIATFLYLNNQPSKEIVQKQPPIKHDIHPGGNKAILTLADGSVIVLDSAANGSVASQGNSRIIKLDNGKLVYNSNASGAPADALMYNTISTPRGGQYQVVLADGSKVWLNANSSIKFPAVFAAGERRVEVTGEVYFEVTKDERSPFNVKAGEAIVQVLGTNFNINAYNDEAIMRTTLLAGSVKVSYGGASGVMTPGQCAKVELNNKEKLTINDDPGALNSIAWVNGFFHFEKADITTVMRQLSRWYDIDVEIRTPENSNLDKFGGDIERNLPLTSVLKILESSQVHFKLENKKLIVMP